ncbi:MAG: hypothetical protein ABI591_21770 [Kofleriaceae bacterium]
MDLALGDLVIACEVVIHPLLGDAFVICDRTGEPLTAMSAVDLDRPGEIPIIAEPGKLPPGAGALLLNRIAERATHPLRYAGPYPTPALYRALERSFRASADEATFCDDVLGRALRLARDPVAVEFAPAPHIRVEFSRGFTELRDGVERAVVDGVTYTTDGQARLVELRAELWFGATRYAHVATFSAAGALVDGPHAIPPSTSDVIGREFPPPLRAAIAELIADAVPAPLRVAAREVVTQRTIVWSDLGARGARRTASGFAVHAAIWDHVSPLGLAHVALALTDVLAPVVTHAIVAELQPRLPA